MILTAHQPTYLPWLGYFQKIALSDIFVWMDDVKYTKESAYSRNVIKTNRFATSMLSVPVRSGSNNMLIKDVKIANEHCWQNKHWRAIKAGYSSAPYWHLYSPFLIDVYLEKKWTNLAELDWVILKEAIKWFTLSTKLVKASDYKFTGHKSELILNYCKFFGANKYIFGKHGKNYADLNLFKSNNIDLIFQDYQYPLYAQQFDDKFISNLSFIDFIFNCGPDLSRLQFYKSDDNV